MAYPLGEFAAFAILLFVVRFMMRGHLVPQIDEECTVGGVAVNVLAQGIRFPLRVYAPNDYENGFFYSALLAATSFSLLGRNVLAIKLATHLVVSLGTVATLWLLRSCLDELRLNARRVRWTAIAVFVVAMAFSPREVVLFSTWNVGIGSHAEGTAIDMVLLAVFARRRARWSTVGIAVFWVLMGLALHVNKGTLVLVLVLAVAELSLSQSSPRRLAAVLIGFLLGIVPELLRMASPDVAGGWATIASKLTANAREFPAAFVRDVLALADYRSELLATWVLAIGGAMALLGVARRRGSTQDGASPPSALGMTLGLLVLHVAGLTVMATGGNDNHAMHMYPPLVTLTAVLAGWLCSVASKRWGVRAGSWAGAMLVGLTVVVHRPQTLRFDAKRVAELWGKRASAACSWRFGEAFMREPSERGVNYSLLGTAALTGRDKQSYLERERQAIELCRSLSEPTQILDCIGGIARELQYGSGRIDDGEPPSGLSDIERRAYAFYYGVRRAGHMTACDDFHEPALRKECRTAAQVDCFIYVDTFARFESGDPLPRPPCDMPAPPMDGYWAEMRLDLVSRPPGSPPRFPPGFGGGSIGACQAVVDSCY